jgi:uncharacterized membrane protein YcaP (DUF421 family)
LTRDIIIDGKIMYDNLRCINHNEQWVKKQLKIHNINDVEDVFYAGVDTSGNFYFSPKTKKFSP